MLVRRYLPVIIYKNVIFRPTFTAPPERLRLASDLVWNVIESTEIKSVEDWKHFRKEIVNSNSSVSSSNIDALTLGVCTSKQQYDLALSYVDFLEKEQFKLNLATLGKYFKLLYIKGVTAQLCKDDEERILGLYESVRKTHPVLDALSLENIIQAISLTHKWELCVDLLNELKISVVPTAVAYSTVIAAAFSNNVDDLAWKLLNEALGHGKNILAIVYSSYFKRIARNPIKFNISKEIDVMLKFLEKNCLKLSSEDLDAFEEHFKMMQIDFHVCPINPHGICKSCKSELKAIDLTESEFANLKTNIIQNVIVGRDVFNKTTPEELHKFKSFISNMEVFDVVIDGLNVAYSVGVKQSPLVTSGLVAAVVSYFVNQGMKVLVLGRNHMTRWPRQNWGYIQQNATTFLTQDLSQDDPYLLYCALNSGKDTIIVTRDLMRSHKFHLKNGHLKLLFDRWLFQRQYHLVRVQDSQIPIFKKPLPYSTVAQKNGKYWHVPLLPTDKAAPSNIWLCVKC